MASCLPRHNQRSKITDLVFHLPRFPVVRPSSITRFHEVAEPTSRGMHAPAQCRRAPHRSRKYNTQTMRRASSMTVLQPPFWRICCLLVSNRQDAEDLLLRSLWLHSKMISFLGLPVGDSWPWLRRVAWNKVVDRYRHSAPALAVCRCRCSADLVYPLDLPAAL